MKQFEPTSKKLRDARQKGDIAKSREFTLLGSCLGALSLLFCGDLLVGLFVQASAEVWETGQINNQCLLAFSLLGAAALTVLGLLSLVFEGLQVGVQFNFSLLKPDFSKLSPDIKKFKGWSKKLLKFSLVAVVGILSSVLMFVLGSSQTLNSALSWSIGVYLFWAVPLGLIDRPCTLTAYKKKHRMDVSELKREFRESEGAPEMKQARRDNYIEIMHNSQNASVRNSKVVLVSD